MNNWSVDEKKFKKESPQHYTVWRLSQLINYGLDGEKLDRKQLKRLWSEVKTKIDPNSKIYLEYLLWNKKPSSKNITETFWNMS